MVALILQQELAREIERITKDVILKNPQGNIKSMKAYEQSLPKLSLEEEDDPFPYCIVRIVDGSIPDVSSAQTISMVLIFGVYDDGDDMQGHKSILTIIQRIMERFSKDPILSNQFVFNQKVDWTLQEDDTYPYYFGGMELLWTTSSIRREDYLS